MSNQVREFKDMIKVSIEGEEYVHQLEIVKRLKLARGTLNILSKRGILRGTTLNRTRFYRYDDIKNYYENTVIPKRTKLRGESYYERGVYR